MAEETTHYLSSIVEAIMSRKGNEIISLELGVLPNSVCKYFVICHADSTTQVEAIAENIEQLLHEDHNLKPWHKSGFENRVWIILDYLDIVVHVFQTDTRQYYKLEELWADAPSKTYQEEFSAKEPSLN